MRETYTSKERPGRKVSPGQPENWMRRQKRKSY